MEDLRPHRLPRLRRVLGFVRPFRAQLAVVLTLCLTAAALGALEPLILKMIFDDLEDGGGSTRVLAVGVGCFVGMLALREMLTALSNWLTWRTRLRLHFQLLESAVDRLHRLSVSYHQQSGVGAVMTRLERGIQGFLGAFNEIAFNTLPALIYLALSIFFMARLDWQLALVVIGLSPVPVVVAALAGPIQARRERHLLDRWALIYSRFNEVLGGIATVKSFTREDAEQRRFLRSVARANRVVERGVGFDSLVRAGQGAIVVVARAAALGFGGYRVVQGDISTGTLVAFLGYVAGLFGPVQGLIGIYETLQRASAALDTLFDIFDEPEAVRDASDAIELESVRGEVHLEQLRFHYPGGDDVLRGLDLHVQAGETIALVGPSGSGKTTIASLLQRFWDPVEGRVTIDGHDLREVTQRSLRRHIGVVHQEPLLFRDSVAANIGYGRPGASAAVIAEAARAANAHEFILRLPDGYQTVVGERGSKLSGGQRQRLAIARVLVKDPPILILDEATSALDAETEAQVQEAIERVAAGRTTFIIAHRLSTVLSADRIVVLGAGRVAEVGTHDELMARGGVYASLVAQQLGGRGRL